MIRSTEHTTYTAPTALPVNLADALNSRRALWDYAGMVGGALVATLGGGAASLGLAEDMAYRTAGAWLWLLLGALLFAGGVVTFASSFGRYRWYHQFERRLLEEYAALDLESRRAGAQQVVVSNVKAWEFAAHVIEPGKWYTAVSGLIQMAGEEISGERLYKQGIIWRIGNVDKQVLTFSSVESANKFLNALAGVGIIEGRGERRGGRVVDMPLDNALQLAGRAMIRAERGG